MKLEEVAAVQIWRKWQLSEIRGSSRCLRLEDASVQNLDDHLLVLPKQTTNPAIAKVVSLSLPLN